MIERAQLGGTRTRKVVLRHGWAMFKDALISILTRGYYEGNYYTESLDKYLGDPNYKELTSKDYNVLWI